MEKCVIETGDVAFYMASKWDEMLMAKKKGRYAFRIKQLKNNSTNKRTHDLRASNVNEKEQKQKQKQKIKWKWILTHHETFLWLWFGLYYFRAIGKEAFIWILTTTKGKKQQHNRCVLFCIFQWFRVNRSRMNLNSQVGGKIQSFVYYFNCRLCDCL